MTQDEAKLLVAKRAVEFVEDGMGVGLGTGSTATMFIRELGKRVAGGGLKIRCVASSQASEELGLSLGMTVTTLDELPELDMYIDGADEVSVRPGAGLRSDQRRRRRAAAGEDRCERGEALHRGGR